MSEQPTALPQAILDALACSRFLRRQLDSRSWLAARLALSIDAPLDATALRDFLRDEKIDDNNLKPVLRKLGRGSSATYWCATLPAWPI